MAGRCEGVSALAWCLCEDVFPHTAAAWPWGATGGGHPHHPASADAGRGGDKRTNSVGRMVPWTALVPPGQGAARAVPAEVRPRACHPLPHRRGGLPWAHRPASAQGDERAAVQVWYPRPKRGWKTKQNRGLPNTSCHDAKPSAQLPGFRRHPGGWGPLRVDGSCFAALLAIATMHIWMHRLIVG
jgi:hypothetical protein